MNLPTLDPGWVGAIVVIGLHFGWLTPTVLTVGLLGIVITGLLMSWYLGGIGPITVAIGIFTTLVVGTAAAFLRRQYGASGQCGLERTPGSGKAGPTLVPLCLVPAAPEPPLHGTGGPAGRSPPTTPGQPRRRALRSRRHR
uniref:Uncharacterized protein n=1 Tax=Candidatus Kentrum eta TaxID=2126337 RepID=A0A450VK09_9GAMM|nr:MAG: hypothetical protein BECKH772B_GA0070898_104902 [Candidatus Kentron sp. H]VFK05060.1 MAG: hypothetical protein BECKH772A_GA0070896_104972 [Candidatus Kentron sp. H]VFK08125.1 MAG: hypothetical protein BECKH772C_GA0070978_104892 [Candidatus Kentron sp. H]